MKEYFKFIGSMFAIIIWGTLSMGPGFYYLANSLSGHPVSPIFSFIGLIIGILTLPICIKFMK